MRNLCMIRKSSKEKGHTYRESQDLTQRNQYKVTKKATKVKATDLGQKANERCNR